MWTFHSRSFMVFGNRRCHSIENVALCSVAMVKIWWGKMQLSGFRWLPEMCLFLCLVFALSLVSCSCGHNQMWPKLTWLLTHSQPLPDRPLSWFKMEDSPAHYLSFILLLEVPVHIRKTNCRWFTKKIRSDFSVWSFLQVLSSHRSLVAVTSDQL